MNRSRVSGLGRDSWSSTASYPVAIQTASAVHPGGEFRRQRPDQPGFRTIVTFAGNTNPAMRSVEALSTRRTSSTAAVWRNTASIVAPTMSASFQQVMETIISNTVSPPPSDSAGSTALGRLSAVSGRQERTPSDHCRQALMAQTGPCLAPFASKRDRP